MAEVVSVVATCLDSEGKPTVNIPIYAPVGDTVAHYQSFFEAYADVLDDVTGAQLVGGSITIPLTLPVSGIKTAPVNPSYNERGANVLMAVTDSTFNESFRIPAVKASLVSGDNVNLAATEIAALTNFLVAGDGVVIPKTRAGLDMEGTGIAAKKTFRRK